MQKGIFLGNLKTLPLFYFYPQGGSASPDLSTPSGSETPLTIRLLYGHSVAKELLPIKVSSKNVTTEEDADMEDDVDDPEAWKAEAHITNANYQAKKMIFLLFINRECFSLQNLHC